MMPPSQSGNGRDWTGRERNKGGSEGRHSFLPPSTFHLPPCPCPCPCPFHLSFSSPSTVCRLIPALAPFQCKCRLSLPGTVWGPTFTTTYWSDVLCDVLYDVYRILKVGRHVLYHPSSNVCMYARTFPSEHSLLSLCGPPSLVSSARRCSIASAWVFLALATALRVRTTASHTLYSGLGYYVQ